MKILLLQDIPKLGKKGDIVEVSGGYAKNALFPKRLAKLADESVIRQWKAQKEHEEKNRQSKRELIQSILPKIQTQKFQFQIPVGKGGGVFTSLHKETIEEHVLNFCKQQNATFSKEDVRVETKPIKQLGETKIPLQFGRGVDAVTTEITIELAPEVSLNR